MKKPAQPADLTKLKGLLDKVPPDRRPIADSLYRELGYIYKTLVELKSVIDRDGVTTLFKQGSQEFLRENPALKSYTNLLPKYSALYKQVADLLPAVSPAEAPSELQKFLNESRS